MSGIRTRSIRSGVHHSNLYTLSTPPRIWWRISVWFKYITLTATLILVCVRIINVSTSVWRMELSVGRFLQAGRYASMGKKPLRATVCFSIEHAHPRDDYEYPTTRRQRKLQQNNRFKNNNFPPLYQDLSTCHDWPGKKPLSICQSGWRKIWNAFPVIHWLRWGPRTRKLALLRRC